MCVTMSRLGARALFKGMYDAAQQTAKVPAVFAQTGVSLMGSEQDPKHCSYTDCFMCGSRNVVYQKTEFQWQEEYMGDRRHSRT